MTCIDLCLHVMSDVFQLNMPSDYSSLFYTHPMVLPTLTQLLVSFFDGVYVVVFQLHPDI